MCVCVLLPLVFVVVVSSSLDFSSLRVSWLLGALQQFSLPVIVLLSNTQNTRSHSSVLLLMLRCASTSFEPPSDFFCLMSFVTVIAISYCYVCLGFYCAQIKHNDITIIGEKRRNKMKKETQRTINRRNKTKQKRQQCAVSPWKVFNGFNRF